MYETMNDYFELNIHQNNQFLLFCWRFSLYHDENLNLTCQESGRMRDWVDSCLRGLCIFLADVYVLLDQPGKALCQSLSPWTSWSCDSPGLRGRLERICWSLLNWQCADFLWMLRFTFLCSWSLTLLIVFWWIFNLKRLPTKWICLLI